MKRLRREKQREEEDGFTEERIRQKWGTREELRVLQRSSKQEERGQKGAKREWAFVGVDVMALWGICLQGAGGGAVWRRMGGGRIRSAVAQEEDGAKQGLSLIHLALSPFFYLHRLKLPQIPLTRNPLSAASHPKGSWHNRPPGAHAWALPGRRNGHWKNCTQSTEGQLLLSPGKIMCSALL